MLSNQINVIMQIIQSFLFSIGRGGMSLYEQRILLAVVENCQELYKGKVIYKLKPEDIDIPQALRVVLNARDILTDGSKHYEYVRDAARSLARKTMEYWDTQRNVWRLFSLIDNVTYYKGSGQLSFYVNYQLLAIICDFSKGFSRFELNTAFELQSTYSVRLYSLLCSCSRPWDLRLDELRRIFDTGDKYKQNADFIKKIIKPAKEELDAKGCNSFNYELIKDRQKIVAIRFIPLKRAEPTVDELAAKCSLSFFVDREIYLLLMNYMNFTYKELSSHKKLLKAFCSLPAAIDRIRNILTRAKRKDKSKGYIIEAMRSEVTHFKG